MERSVIRDQLYPGHRSWRQSKVRRGRFPITLRSITLRSARNYSFLLTTTWGGSDDRDREGGERTCYAPRAALQQPGDRAAAVGGGADGVLKFACSLSTEGHHSVRRPPGRALQDDRGPAKLVGLVEPGGRPDLRSQHGGPEGQQRTAARRP